MPVCYSAVARDTVVLAEGGGLFACGMGGDGRLGLGDVEDRHSPSFVEELAHTPVQEVFAGSVHTCVLTRTGSVYSFGKHEYTGHGAAADVLVDLEHQLEPPEAQRLTRLREWCQEAMRAQDRMIEAERRKDRLARIHPDKIPGFADGTKAFQALVRAYELCCKPDLRADDSDDSRDEEEDEEDEEEDEEIGRPFFGDRCPGTDDVDALFIALNAMTGDISDSDEHWYLSAEVHLGDNALKSDLQLRITDLTCSPEPL